MAKLTLTPKNLMKEIISVCTQTELDISSKTEISSTPGFFGNPQTFLIQTVAHCSSLRFDADDEFSSLQSVTLLDN